MLARPRSAFAGRLAGLNLVRGTWLDDAVRSERLVVHGLVEGDAPAEGEPAIAAFRPQAVAVYREEVHGSPRNAFSVTVTEVEPRGDLVRVHAGDLAADITVQAAADLELAAGSRVTFTVKATEISVYGL